MLPRYGEWERRYRDRGLIVIGVHTPETDAEDDPSSLAAFVAARKIRWTVVPDRYYDAWRRYAVAAWPTVFLIGRSGLVRAAFVGDDRAGAIEAEIERLLVQG
jgi:hypothetical protein